MTDLQDVGSSRVKRPQSTASSNLLSCQSESVNQARVRVQAERALENRIEELAIEQYDVLNRHPEDVYDKVTKVKTAGHFDENSLNRWQTALEKTLKRRIARSKEKMLDVKQLQEKLNIKSKIQMSRPSLELYAAMGYGQKLAD